MYTLLDLLTRGEVLNRIPVPTSRMKWQIVQVQPCAGECKPVPWYPPASMVLTQSPHRKLGARREKIFQGHQGQRICRLTPINRTVLFGTDTESAGMSRGNLTGPAFPPSRVSRIPAKISEVNRGCRGGNIKSKRGAILSRINVKLYIQCPAP